MAGVRVVTAFSGAGTVEAVLTGTESVGASELDPAIVAHVLPIKHWAIAWWEGWQTSASLDAAWEAACVKLRSAKRSVWDLVTGPTAAVIASAWRLGWT